MDNLPLQALVFIYKDGNVETVPITKFKYHLDALQNNIENMPRFLKLYYKYKFTFHEYVNYLPIANILAKEEGVLTLVNFNLRDIVKDVSLLNYDLPGFFIYLPEKFDTLEQLQHVEQLLMNYPKNRINFNLFQSVRFYEKTFEEVEEFVRTCKSSFDENHTI